MCNLSEAIEEKALERGIEQGIERGIEQGVRALVETCMDFGATQAVTLEKLMKKFELTKEKAQEAIEQYWK